MRSYFYLAMILTMSGIFFDSYIIYFHASNNLITFGFALGMFVCNLIWMITMRFGERIIK